MKSIKKPPKKLKSDIKPPKKSKTPVRQGIMLKILRYLFPNHECAVCGREIDKSERANICDTCGGGLPFNENIKSGEHFRFAFSPYDYNDNSRKLVLDLKYGNNAEIAKIVAPDMVLAIPPNYEYDYFVPVPLFKKRERKRGYNQAEYLAYEVFELVKNKSNAVLCTDIVIRVRMTTPQEHMTETERAKNQRGAYQVTDEAQIKNKRILLIDDVLTSGATCDEIARVLRKHGVKFVDVLTIAQVRHNVD